MLSFDFLNLGIYFMDSVPIFPFHLLSLDFADFF